ncbi:hypothetical protein QO058_28900 [Bosea vestrisii]|uniref:hypothetical protein n=1 Tax=Bosea vestrisii TaxID=151416 RepID=UPI0024DF8263|nr:hypothetical protein [Bosea vestrisii]WID96675.1 hypothetical protein QO058_28900 [Bosea vestrisii]
MTIALAIVVAMYLVGAGLIALNSAFEAQRSSLGAIDLIIIALVSMAWPAFGCALLLMLACQKAFSKAE